MILKVTNKFETITSEKTSLKSPIFVKADTTAETLMKFNQLDLYQ